MDLLGLLSLWLVFWVRSAKREPPTGIRHTSYEWNCCWNAYIPSAVQRGTVILKARWLATARLSNFNGLLGELLRPLYAPLCYTAVTPKNTCSYKDREHSCKYVQTSQGVGRLYRELCKCLQNCKICTFLQRLSLRGGLSESNHFIEILFFSPIESSILFALLLSGLPQSVSSVCALVKLLGFSGQDQQHDWLLFPMTC